MTTYEKLEYLNARDNAESLKKIENGMNMLLIFTCIAIVLLAINFLTRKH